MIDLLLTEFLRAAEAAKPGQRVDCVGGCSGVLTLLMEFEQQLEQQQVAEVLHAVLELLNACDVTDARDCGWESTTHFGSVFDLLMVLAKEPTDKKACIEAQMHCILLCWKTDRVPRTPSTHTAFIAYLHPHHPCIPSTHSIHAHYTHHS